MRIGRIIRSCSFDRRNIPSGFSAEGTPVDLLPPLSALLLLPVPPTILSWEVPRWTPPSPWRTDGAEVAMEPGRRCRWESISRGVRTRTKTTETAEGMDQARWWDRTSTPCQPLQEEKRRALKGGKSPKRQERTEPVENCARNRILRTWNGRQGKELYLLRIHWGDLGHWNCRFDREHRRPSNLQRTNKQI